MPKIKNKNVLWLNNSVYLPYVISQGEPWFKAKDVAQILDYQNARQAIIEHVSFLDKKILKEVLPSNHEIKNAQNHQVYINLKGIYRLLTLSQKPKAKQLHDWLDQELGLK